MMVTVDSYLCWPADGAKFIMFDEELSTCSVLKCFFFLLFLSLYDAREAKTDFIILTALKVMREK